MTPTQKAEELFDLINNQVPISDEWDINDTSKEAIAKLAKNHVATKKICLILVTEVLNALPMYNGSLNPKWAYWEEVQKELTKL